MLLALIPGDLSHHLKRRFFLQIAHSILSIFPQTAQNESPQAARSLPRHLAETVAVAAQSRRRSSSIASPSVSPFLSSFPLCVPLALAHALSLTVDFSVHHSAVAVRVCTPSSAASPPFAARRRSRKPARRRPHPRARRGAPHLVIPSTAQEDRRSDAANHIHEVDCAAV